jgi:tetratricopeptide (TPR) repeat protein
MFGEHYQTMELDILYWLANARGMREFKKSSELEDFIEKTTKKFGPNHQFTLRLSKIYAIILCRTGKSREGISVFEDIVEKCETYLDEGDLVTADVKRNYAYYLKFGGDFERTSELLKSAIAIYAAKLGVSSYPHLNAQAKLAETYLFSGKVGDALRITKTYTTKSEQHLGPGHRTTIEFLELMAMSYGDQEKFDKAIQILEQHLLRTRPNGVNTLNSGTSLERLGAAYKKKGDVSKAIEFLQQSFAVRKKFLGFKNRDTHGSLQLLLLCLAEQREFEEVERYARMSRNNIIPQMLGANKIFDRSNKALVEALKAQGKLLEAKIEAQKTLEDVRQEVAELE